MPCPGRVDAGRGGVPSGNIFMGPSQHLRTEPSLEGNELGNPCVALPKGTGLHQSPLPAGSRSEAAAGEGASNPPPYPQAPRHWRTTASTELGAPWSSFGPVVGTEFLPSSPQGDMSPWSGGAGSVEPEGAGREGGTLQACQSSGRLYPWTRCFLVQDSALGRGQDGRVTKPLQKAH